MRYLIMFLAVLGVVVSFLSVVGYYGPPADTANLLHTNWNSAYVDQSNYSTVFGYPLALLGAAGFALLAVVALQGRVVGTAYSAGIVLAYTLYLTSIESQTLHVWNVYWVSSFILAVLTFLLALVALVFDVRR
jgi:uncharacterized membrane protein